MAKIEKMSIAGLRSYSPNIPAVIEFQTPLTLIVGTNGSGKTSVIECLNHIITGNYPPGTKSQAFVHDPKIAGEKEVKGQIKLRMQDMLGNKLHCIRTMTATQKLKKIEVKSIEGVIMKITPSGERESISSRCTDFTKEMISRLGVSKAVVENVIFCHQEDANWPLSEGKTLKAKFDEIFSATRYIKALESIRSVNKDQQSNCKVYQADLKHLAERKDEFLKKKEELEKTELQKTVSVDSINKITEKIEPVLTQLKELDAVSEDIYKVDKKIGELHSAKDQLNRNINDLEKKIKEPFKGEFKELLRLRSEFKEKLELKETTLGDLRSCVKRFDMEIKQMSENQGLLNQKQGKLQQEAENFNNLVLIRDELVKKLAIKYDIDRFESGKYSSPEVANFMSEMKGLHDTVDKEGKMKRKDFDLNIETLNSEIRKLEKSLNGFESNIEQKKKLIAVNDGKINTISESLNSLIGSENRIQSLELDFSRAEIELKEFKQELDIGKAKEEIDSLSVEKETEDRLLSQLREEEGRMIQQSKAQTKVDILSKDKKNKENTIDSLLRRHQDSLSNLFETKPAQEDLKSELTQYMRSKQVEIHKLTQEYQKIAQTIAAKEGKKKMLQEQFLEKEQKVSKSKQKIHEACQENDYNEFREMLQQKVEKHNSILVEIGAFEKIYQKYLQQLRKESDDNKGCPLCHRKFSDSREVRNFIEELSQKLSTVPEKRDRNQKDLDESKILHEKIIKLAPVQANLESLNEDIPRMKKELGDLCTEIEKERSMLNATENKKTATEECEKYGRSMESDVRKMDDCLFELKDLDRQLSMESSKLSGITPGRTMQSLRAEVQDKQESFKMLSRKIDQKKNHLMEHQNQLSIREKDVNDLKSRKLNLQAQLQKRTQLEDQKAEMSSTNQSFEREIREALTRLQPIKDELGEKSEYKRNTEESKEKNDDDVRNKLQKIKTSCGEIKEKSEWIEKYINDGKQSDLQNNEEQLNNINERLNKKIEMQDKKKNEMTSIQEEINNQSLKQYEIDDNIKLMKTRKDIEKVDLSIEELKKELQQFGNYQMLIEERSSCQERLDELRKEKAVNEGLLRGLDEKMKMLNRELNSRHYKDADVNHCQKLVELRTTQLANKDLDKYYKALDQAIGRFHRLKLQEINKIIKEYWVKTYRGHDIDTIEIVSEDDEEGSGASKTKRNYNYRVCMIKGGIPIDMRSRCSAGQKVLASIIIRLALAETFCLNCGIFALDEPTTNLDEDNIESLANALKDIIQMRMQQRNFQLIIITHDEEFVQGLGRSDYVDHYFRIYKDDEGHSKIHKRIIEDRT